ncbi:outer membrane autotransporter [Alcanivorax sp. MD8A]|uniref:autotransporter family protein n=1 Tax=Alcanivorax sp. MD8A TaxID=1177157 RepID=UPI000C9D0C2C|nr:autotransporter domain-containing protein [Alcanivorax sp. MD8A]PNE02339.1 outer membrane autotransporter [Alcanivorax sp. MD8A]
MSLFNRRHHGGESHAVRAEILCALGAALAFLLLLPGAASAAADGADGSGHDGVTGGQGQDGGDGGPFDDGGNGGDGASLVYSGAPAYEASTTTGIDADITDLTSLAGINNGDQLRVTVNGVVTNITINTGDKLIDLAAAIDQIISPFEMSASVTDSGSGGDQLIIEGAQNFLDLQITNITGTPISATGIHFVNLPGTLGDASRPFSHGGDGGDGGAGSMLAPGDYYFTFSTSGGDGGAGGSSDYFHGNGGAGGNGGPGLLITSPGDRFTLFSGAEFHGGNGGNGGAGGAEGIGGDGGDGGAGIQADASAEITMSAGALVAGGDGGQGGAGSTPGNEGIGGYGITGSNLDVTLAGTVIPGANQPTAILFAGGDNRLTLESGYSLGGNVLANGSNDVLALGGDVDGSFFTNVLGSTFQGFEGFEKTGASTWTLTGGRPQDWWVREGTLQGNADNLGGNILNDAHVLIEDSSSSSIYQGAISGSGSVTWALSGSMDLSNKQTYTGLTHVLDGVLRGVADTFAGDILIEAGTQITTNGGAAPVQYDGVISGDGIYFINYANVVWTGDHTSFTGLTRLNNGATLTLGTGGNTGTIVGDVAFRGTPSTLEINRGNDYLYDGVISGAGNLLKNGAGNYILSADHSMTGNATVNAGGMFVNGAMNGVAFTVNDGGLLGGNGSLGSTTVNTGGTLAPGNSIGTLNINGDLTFHSGSSLALEVDPASNSGDVINVTGEAFLAGSVLHVGNDGDYQPFSAYTFLNAAGGITGQFDGVTSNYAFLDPSLTYTTDSVSLALLRNDQSFASVVLTDNQRAVANNVDGMASAHALYQQVVQMSETEAAEAFRVFSGDSLLAGLTAGQQLQQRFAIGMRQRGRNVGSHSGGGMDARLSRQLQALAAPSDAYAQAANSAPVAAQAAGEDQQRQRHGVWVQAQSSRFEEDRQDDIGNAAFTFRGDQLALGMDRQGEQWLLGVAAGSADGTLDYDDRQADGEVSSWFAGLYGRWSSMGAWFLRGDLSYGSSDVSQQRIVLGAPAESDSSVDALRVALESGWDLAWGENGLHPYVQLAMTRIERDSFSETGGGIAGLTVDDSELNSGEAWLGADLSRAFVMGGDWFVAEGGLAVVQPFGDTQPEQTARFAGAQQGFTVYGADQDDTQLAANAGAEWFMTADFSLWLGYRGRFGGDTESHGGLLSANLTW